VNDYTALLGLATSLIVAVISYRLGRAAGEAKDLRDLSDRLREQLRGRVNMHMSIYRPTEDEFHRLMTLTPWHSRRRLRAAIAAYQRANSDIGEPDSYGQQCLRDPAGMQAARDALLRVLP
jgi:hypothetical protein